MNKEELYRSMDGIDDEILQKYYEYKPASKIVNFKEATVIAASVCLLIVAGTVIKLMTNVPAEDGAFESMDEIATESYSLEGSSDEKSTEIESEAVEGALERRFTITACASENEKTLLDSGKTVPLKLGPNYTTYGFSETENDGIAFHFYLPQLIVEGENIANITYSVNKYDVTVYNYSYGADGKIDKTNGTTEFGKEYTVSYADQLDKYFRVVVGGEVPSDEKLHHDIFEPDRAEDRVPAINQILDGVTVTCTVTYEDGTTESADIIMAAEYHTYDELDDVYDESFKTGAFEDGTDVMTFELR